MRLFRLTLTVLLFSLASTSNAEAPTNFNSAKDEAERLWWDIGSASFYCQCPYRLATD